MAPWLRITPVVRKRYEISFRFRQRRARYYAEITLNRALFSETTKNTALPWPLGHARAPG
jgi:hypothetical protein